MLGLIPVKVLPFPCSGVSERAQKLKNNISEEKKVNWRDLVAFDDDIKELSIRVEKFEEMACRNKIEKEFKLKNRAPPQRQHRTPESKSTINN
ncbi:hypothetical protein SADUNF_Sadunf03G0089600 [Salix dunnii]|uniref:Uncharacterized protein n=1 Tax=Salix dunnii TaxID=1413687 RepID=A0A835KAQ9_9ROSI|nr:hypothetical protein SADUNF_Sadunf03G0089600 [Salix dunnii]